MLPLLRAGLIRLPSGFPFGKAKGAFYAALYNSGAKKKNITISFLVFISSVRFT